MVKKSASNRQMGAISYGPENVLENKIVRSAEDGEKYLLSRH